jgi:hypothetical protein
VWHRDTNGAINWLRWIIVSSRPSHIWLLLTSIGKIRWLLRNIHERGETGLILRSISQLIQLWGINSFPLRRVNSLSLRRVNVPLGRINNRPLGRIRLLSLRTPGGIWDTRIRLSKR